MPFVVRSDGCRLYYEMYGASEQRTPLVLLEGMGGDVSGWRRNIPRLSERRPVVAFDFRGNGRSDKPDTPTSMATFVEDTAALLDALGVEAADLYGQSFGGMVGIELALARPGRVRALVLAATHAGRARATKVGEDGKVPKDRPHLALYSSRFAREHPEHVADDLREAARDRQPAHARRRQWEALQGWDAWDRLGAVRCPTLVVHGTEDRLVPVENARRLAAAIPGARLVLLEGAGHVYHSEQPEVADVAVLEFLEEIDGRS